MLILKHLRNGNDKFTLYEVCLKLIKGEWISGSNK